jgi:hypothetical protein
LPIDLFFQCPEDACPWIDDGRAGWDKRHTFLQLARAPMWMMVDQREEATARPLTEARSMQARGLRLSFFGSSTGIAPGDGESVRRR